MIRKVIDFIENLKKSIPQENFFFDKTQSQNSEEWLAERDKIITATRAYVFSKNWKNPEQKCYSQRYKRIVQTEAMKYGQLQEKNARESYQKLFPSCLVTTCGLLIKTHFPFFGASPDGLIDDKQINQQGILEIKCPKVLENIPFSNWDFSKISFLRKNSQSIDLKESHEYFYQIQWGLFITKRQFCDFFIFSKVDHFCLRIEYNKSFIQKIFQKIFSNYVCNYLPEYIFPSQMKQKSFQTISESDFNLHFSHFLKNALD